MASSTVSPSAVILELLNLDNYEYWSRCVKTFLLAEGLWKVVEATGDPDAKREDGDVWSRQDAKALHVIHISSGSAFFPLIRDATSARDAWNMLAGKFRSESSMISLTGILENNGADVTLQEDYLALFNREVVDWDAVIEFLNESPEAARVRHPGSGKTCLHRAVSQGDSKVVEKILNFLEEIDLEVKDVDGKTTFFYAVWSGKIEIIKCLVRKNKGVVSTCSDHGPHKNVIPVLLALWKENMVVANYLYPLTPKEDLNPENGHNGADIITHSIQKKFFGKRNTESLEYSAENIILDSDLSLYCMRNTDIAWDLIQR